MSTVDALFIGEDPVSAAYMGTTPVWTAADADPELVQIAVSSAQDFSFTDTPATFASTPTEGSLLIATYHTRATAPTISMSGWTLARSDGNGRLFYKKAGAAEASTHTVVSTVAGRSALVLQEWSGMATDDMGTILDEVDGGSTGGTPTSATVGPTAATDSARQLVIAVVHLLGTSGGWGSWTDGFDSVVQHDNGSGTSGQRTAQAVASKFVITTGTQSTSVSWTTGRANVDQIVTFRAAS